MKNLIASIQKNWIQFLLDIFVPMGVIWGFCLEAFIYFIGDVPDEYKIPLYIFLWLLGISYAIYRAHKAIPPPPLTEIELTIANRKVVVKVGNVFNEVGFCKVIPVSSYFYETELEMPNSLQAKLIERINKPIYLDILNKALKNITPVDTNARSFSNKNLNKKYALGTTIRLEASNNENYLLFPLTESEMKPMPSPNCDVTRLWQALEKFWESASVEAKGESIAIPLIGDNVNNINLHPVKTLELNLLAILYAFESRKLQLPSDRMIEIIIFEGNDKVKNAIDLREVKQIWNKPNNPTLELEQTHGKK